MTFSACGLHIDNNICSPDVVLLPRTPGLRAATSMDAKRVSSRRTLLGVSFMVIASFFYGNSEYSGIILIRDSRSGVIRTT